MFPVERQSTIMEILRQQGRCLVGELAQHLEVSEVTVRQDLALLEQQGALQRTHGGAILKMQSGLEQPFGVVETANKPAKERIAAAALRMIAPGDTVILDVGTTVTEVAKRLLDFKNITVFTNALNIATILEANPAITVIVMGGMLRAKQHSLVNPYGGLILEKIQVDLALIGIGGISVSHGVTNVNIPEAEMKTLFFKAARRKVVLADASKVGKVALAKVADIGQVDLLITERTADKQELAAFREQGLEIKLV